MKRIKWIATIILLLLVVFSLQLVIDQEWADIIPKRPLILVPGEFANVAIIGGFREISRDILWLKCDEYWESYAYYKMWPLLRTIHTLDPKFIRAWTIAGWHAAYNLSAGAQTGKDYEAEKEWINTGIEVLKEGIADNPDRYDIYWELAWTYYDKLKDYPQAIKWFQKVVTFKTRPRPADKAEHAIQRCYEKMRPPQWEKALYWVYRCLQTHPTCGVSLRDKEWYSIYKPKVKPHEDEPIEELAKQMHVELRDKYNIREEKIKQILVYKFTDPIEVPEYEEEEIVTPPLRGK